jgi:hypothetical protein
LAVDCRGLDFNWNGSEWRLTVAKEIITWDLSTARMAPIQRFKAPWEDCDGEKHGRVSPVFFDSGMIAQLVKWFVRRY